MNAVTIREAAEGDLSGLLELYSQLHGEPVPECGEALLRHYSAILADANHHIIVADEGGRIVSTCVCVIIPNLTHSQRPYAVIENVVTDVSRRRRGLGLACLKRAKRLAQEANCYKMMLMTGSKKESTLSFYERAGYNRSDKTGFIMWLE